jgi:hypothetical protein
MNRRRFLRASSAAALALAAAPAWVRRAFADTACPPEAKNPRALASLAGAYRRAARLGRPLLVLVIPENDSAGWDRGAAFGEYLNHGTDAQLAPLAQVEVACARMHELKRLVPAAPGGEPLMVLIDTRRVPATARALDVALPQYPEHRWRTYDDVRDDAIADRRIQTLADTLARGLAPSGSAPGDEQTLAAEVRARVVKERVPGSYWARSHGCGTIIEGVNDNSSFGCGMGHVPTKSQRFLDFYTGAQPK